MNYLDMEAVEQKEKTERAVERGEESSSTSPAFFMSWTGSERKKMRTGRSLAMKKARGEADENVTRNMET
jgi:hypothetical protein